MTEVAPRLWSDFDGTAVGIVRKIDPRNWSKYPLPGIVGYAHFLRGVSSSGVEIAGVVSRRPNIPVRRLATARSIAKLGYGEFFPEAFHVVYKGSEAAKGRFVAEQTREAPIGMLDDRPHKLGAVLLGILQESDYADISHHPLIIGVVSHGRSQEYIEKLAELAKAMSPGNLVVAETGTAQSTGLAIRSEAVVLDIVQLEPYSQHAGEAFGQRLVNMNAAA